MKKLIAKLEGWGKRNPNKAKILNEICNESLFGFDYIVGITLIIEAGFKGFGLYLLLKILSLAASITVIETNMFLKKWKKAKEKDRKEK